LGPEALLCMPLGLGESRVAQPHHEEAARQMEREPCQANQA